MAKPPQDSVNVSSTLQGLFIASFFTVWGFMLMNIAFYLFFSGGYTDMSYWYIQTLISLLPGLMLAVAWWYAGAQKVLLNRLFLASLIAFMGYMLTMIVQQLAFLIPAGADGRVSDTSQIVEPLVAFSLYVVLLVWAKKGKA